MLQERALWNEKKGIWKIQRQGSCKKRNLIWKIYKMLIEKIKVDPIEKIKVEGGVKLAEEQDGEITFSSTNSLKEQQNGEQSLQNNF